MYSVKFNENDLNVEYTSHFIEKGEADQYLKELKDLPFYTPTFKLRGRNAKPKRQVLAYGDSNTTYVFSGTSIPAQPWTPLMLKLRDCVEKQTACTYNYVLLNLYVDGTSFISQHKDDESELDTTFPIAVLSFGAKRTITFTRPKIQPTSIKLEHGSLYIMKKPTNDLYKHGIVLEPTVKEIRISLTFRHIIPSMASSKKLRLQDPLTKSELYPVNDSLPETSKVCSLSESCSSLSVSSDDSTSIPLQSTNSSQEIESSSIIHAEWDLKEKTFLQIVLEKNFKIRIHIRTFKESSKGDLIPSKMGVVMTPVTWYFFQGKLFNFKLESTNDSFISNNQLLVTSVCDEYCILQQMFPLNTLGFFLKPMVVKLTKDQIFNLLLNCEITESIIEAHLFKVLPKLVDQKATPCLDHISEDIAKENLLNGIAHEVMLCANILYECSGCAENRLSRTHHGCLMEHIILKFRRNRQLILLSLNLSTIVNNLPTTCYCHYNTPFFNHFNILSNEDRALENALEKLSHHKN